MKRFHSNHARKYSFKLSPISTRAKKSTIHPFLFFYWNVCLLLMILFQTTIFVDSFQLGNNNLNIILPRTFRNTNPCLSTTTTTAAALPRTLSFPLNRYSYCGLSIFKYRRYFNHNKNDLIRLHATPTNNNSNNEELWSLPTKGTKNNNDNNNKTKKQKPTQLQLQQQQQKPTSRNVLKAKKTTTVTDLKPKQQSRRRTWEDSYKLLKEYKEQHGDCLVPARYEEDKKLGMWVATQRQQAKKGKLKLERKNKLDEIGFSWDARTDNWDYMFEELKEFKEEFGHCNVELNKYKSRQTLAIWVMTQRKFKALLSNEQRSQLDELSFVWEDVQKARGDRQWEERFEALQDYQRIHGDTQVPFSASHNNVKLGSWVHRQRTNYQQGILRKDREDRLNSIGFIWKLRDTNTTDYEKLNKIWMKNLEKLKDFKTIHGHSNVPQKYKEDPKLGLWVHTQRRHYSLGILKKIRREMLESIGFEWNAKETVYENQWMDQYQDLVTFQKKHGHVDVPFSSHQSLYEWLFRQRAFFAINKLEMDRKELLEKLGIDLNVGPGSGNTVLD